MVVEPGEGGGCEEEHTALSSTGGGARRGGDKEDGELGDTWSTGNPEVGNSVVSVHSPQEGEGMGRR